MELRRSYDHLISTMGFPIMVRRHLYIESGPWVKPTNQWHSGILHMPQIVSGHNPKGSLIACC